MSGNDIINTILAEAGGEGQAGITAVAWVIKNRSRLRGITMEQVVRESGQFEGYSNPGPAAVRLQGDAAARAQVEQILQQIDAGEIADPTGGADFFDTGSGGAIRGIDGAVQSATVGGHTFYTSGQAQASPQPQAAPQMQEVPDLDQYDMQPYGSVRYLPLDQQLQQDIMRAAYNTDPNLGVHINSGGQPALGEGGSRTGSTRHDHGNAGDIVLTRNGQPLTITDSRQAYLDFAESLGATGLPGIGVYPDSEFIHAGGGSELSWGQDGHSASIPTDFLNAIGQGRTSFESGDRLSAVPVLPNAAPDFRGQNALDAIDAMAGPRDTSEAMQAYAALGLELNPTTTPVQQTLEQAMTALGMEVQPALDNSQLFANLEPAEIPPVQSTPQPPNTVPNDMFADTFAEVASNRPEMDMMPLLDSLAPDPSPTDLAMQQLRDNPLSTSVPTPYSTQNPAPYSIAQTAFAPPLEPKIAEQLPIVAQSPVPYADPLAELVPLEQLPQTTDQQLPELGYPTDTPFAEEVAEPEFMPIDLMWIVPDPELQAQPLPTPMPEVVMQAQEPIQLIPQLELPEFTDQILQEIFNSNAGQPRINGYTGSSMGSGADSWFDMARNGHGGGNGLQNNGRRLNQKQLNKAARGVVPRSVLNNLNGPSLSGR